MFDLFSFEFGMLTATAIILSIVAVKKLVSK
jgi:hypothetical protein